MLKQLQQYEAQRRQLDAQNQRNETDVKQKGGTQALVSPSEYCCSPARVSTSNQEQQAAGSETSDRHSVAGSVNDFDVVHASNTAAENSSLARKHHRDDEAEVTWEIKQSSTKLSATENIKSSSKGGRKTEKQSGKQDQSENKDQKTNKQSIELKQKSGCRDKSPSSQESSDSESDGDDKRSHKSSSSQKNKKNSKSLKGNGNDKRIHSQKKEQAVKWR